MEMKKIEIDYSAKLCIYSILWSTVITAFFGYTINASPFFKLVIAVFCWIGVYYSSKRFYAIRRYNFFPKILITFLLLIVCQSFLHSLLNGEVHAGDKMVVIFTNKVAVLDLVGVCFLPAVLFLSELKFVLKASLIFSIASIFLLLFNFDTTEDSYFLGYVLLYTPIFLSYISKRNMLILGIAYIISIFAFFGGGRQIAVLLAFAILAVIIPKYCGKKYTFYISIAICLLPVFLLFWSLNNMSIFEFLSENYGSNDDMSVDTRTFLWQELSSDMFNQDLMTIIFGKGVLGYYESDFFKMNYRFAIEVPILQWFLQAGLAYVFSFTALIFSSIYLLYKNGKNIMCQRASILIASFYFNCYVSNLLGCNIGTLGVWILISFAFNPKILNANELQIKQSLFRIK